MDTLAVQEIMKWIFQSCFSGQIYASEENLFEHLEFFFVVSAYLAHVDMIMA